MQEALEQSRFRSEFGQRRSRPVERFLALRGRLGRNPGGEPLLTVARNLRRSRKQPSYSGKLSSRRPPETSHDAVRPDRVVLLGNEVNRGGLWDITKRSREPPARTHPSDKRGVLRTCVQTGQRSKAAPLHRVTTGSASSRGRACAST